MLNHFIPFHSSFRDMDLNAMMSQMGGMGGMGGMEGMGGMGGGPGGLDMK